MTRNLKRRIEAIEKSVRGNKTAIRDEISARTLRQLSDDQLTLLYEWRGKDISKMTDEQLTMLYEYVELQERECKRAGFNSFKELNEWINGQ